MSIFQLTARFVLDVNKVVHNIIQRMSIQKLGNARKSKGASKKTTMILQKKIHPIKIFALRCKNFLLMKFLCIDWLRTMNFLPVQSKARNGKNNLLRNEKKGLLNCYLRRIYGIWHKLHFLCKRFKSPLRLEFLIAHSNLC